MGVLVRHWGGDLISGGCWFVSGFRVRACLPFFLFRGRACCVPGALPSRVGGVRRAGRPSSPRSNFPLGGGSRVLPAGSCLHSGSFPFSPSGSAFVIGSPSYLTRHSFLLAGGLVFIYLPLFPGVSSPLRGGSGGSSLGYSSLLAGVMFIFRVSRP